MPHAVTARDIAFVMRCTGAAVLSYVIASRIGLAHPLWACISALIVAQEKLEDTTRVTMWRLVGTMTGLLVAVISGVILDRLGATVPLQIGCAVAICATLARYKPDLRVAMWTAPIVFITQTPNESIEMAGVWRAAEVLLGGLIGAALHWISELVIARRGR
jgi:uncharacterized membrane protein YccC